MGLGKYLKAAFKNHWNLLGFLGGTVFAFLTGRPDVALPLVAAAELTYLGLLGTHPRFQAYVDAQEAKSKRKSKRETAEEALRRITRALPAESLARYKLVKAQVNDLRDIARDLHASGRTGGGARPFENLQLKGLDRLLWVFLRLLYSEYALGRFLDHTSERAIRDDIERIEKRLSKYAAEEANPRKVKARKALEDNLQTSQSRLANFLKARENHELVQLEIDRLENKIRTISEMAVNRQEPDFITSQVDSVASSMLETEETMQELDFATGLGSLDETVPELISRPEIKTYRGPP